MQTAVAGLLEEARGHPIYVSKLLLLALRRSLLCPQSLQESGGDSLATARGVALPVIPGSSDGGKT